MPTENNKTFDELFKELKEQGLSDREAIYKVHDIQMSNAVKPTENRLLNEIEKVVDENIGWVDVKNSPLYQIDADGKWVCTEAGNNAFIAALRYNNKNYPNREFWWIMPCLVEDGVGLCIIGDEENVAAGWELSDVEYYKPLDLRPPTSENDNNKELAEAIYDLTETTANEYYNTMKINKEEFGTTARFNHWAKNIYKKEQS